MKKSITLFTLMFLHILTASTQNMTMSKADSLFKSKEWALAAKEFEKITTNNPNPKTGITFNRLGTSYYYLGEFQKAVLAFRRAVEISNHPSVKYSLACTFNKLGLKDSCFAWLNRAASSGFAQYKQMQADEDLASLLNEAQFESVLHKVKVNALPCLRMQEYRQLDFWIGQWRVYDTKTNQLAGTSEISNGLEGCVILESWQPVAGMAGKSMSMYNATDKKWRQTYMDEGGILSDYDGEWIEDTMHFKLRSSNDALVKMTFYKKPNGEVQQIGKTSKDNGVTWEMQYDLTYRKK